MASTYKKSEDLVSREIAGEMILVPVKGRLADLQKIYALNPVGEFIWRQMELGKSLKQIAADIMDNFEANPGEVEGDIRHFVARLLEEGLIEEVK